jgi:hypothetical protein
LQGCQKKHDDDLKFKTFIKTVSPNERITDAKAYYVIPNAGCEGCISAAESFVVDNIDNVVGVKFIFTNFKSAKMLNLKLGKDVVSHKNVILDHGNEFFRAGFESIYPMVFRIKNGSVIHVERISTTDASVFYNY